MLQFLAEPRRCGRATHMVGMLLGLTAVASASGKLYAAAPVETFSNADTIAEWTFSSGPEYPGATGSLKWRGDAGHEGDGCAALSYDFCNGGNYVAAIVPAPAGRDVTAVRMWVKKPSPHLMIFRATDSKGETFQKNFRYHYVGWQQIEIEIGRWIFSWGGDGTFQAPARELHILIENDGGDTTGTVLIDDLQWIDRGDVVDSSVAEATYVEADFGASEKWPYDGAATGGFDAGEWRYAFTESRDVTIVHRDRSFLGQPQRMTLTVESDGSGHELKAWIGSHFQLFERTIGTLDRPGTLHFDVPLGDMTTWRHFGGEDDGIVRYPLRLVMLRLEQRGEPKTGRIALKKLSVTTQYDPQTERVWVIPDATVDEDHDRITFDVTLRSLDDTPRDAELLYKLYSADQQLASETRRVQLPANGRPTTVALTTDWHGASMLEGRFRVQTGDWRSPERSTTVARLPDAAGTHELNPDSRMGVGMYLYRFHGHPEGEQWLRRMCDVASRAGVKWTREEFHWNWIQSERGEWDFTYFDKLVDTATEHGISVYALCCYWTSWTDKCTDEGIEDYCRYLEALVQRYGDRIKHWEIWNEPNIFFWDCGQEMYVKLLNHAYETIKRVDPDAKVLGCSTAGIDVKFIQAVMDQGGRFDDLTIHPYRGRLNGPQFAEELRRTRKLAGGRDVWITEMGWPSNIGGLTERQQAQYVARTYISALASDAVRSIAWYDFREDGDDPFYNEHNFGLVRGDLQPKMGYRALAAVGNILGSAMVERPLDLSDGIVGWRFADDDERIVAMWSQGAARLVRFQATAQHCRFINVVGDEASVVPHDGELLAVLERDTPLYILGDENLNVSFGKPPIQPVVSPPTTHAGTAVELEIGGADEMKVRVAPPPGWQIAMRGDRHVLHVPSNTPPGTHVVEVVITVGTRELRLPVEIPVVPRLLRG